MSKSKVKSKKAPLYAAMINLSGLFCDKPLKCMRNEDWADGGFYYNKSQDLDVSGVGLHDKCGRIEFVSYDKKEVAAWISGASSVMKMLKNWCE